MSVLHSGEDYRVLRFEPNRRSSLSVVHFEHWRPNFSVEDASPFEDVLDVNFLTRFNLNCIVVQTRRNDWFQGADMPYVLEAIRKAKRPGEKYLAYGNSMGGYACIAFFELYGGDYFVTTSPQNSLRTDYATAIGETRWKEVWQSFRYDFIRDGASIGAKGLVMVDKVLNVDLRHAEDIVSKTNAVLVDCPGTWHHSGKIVQREWGLVKFVSDLAAVVEKDGDIEELVVRLQTKLRDSLPGKFMAANGAERLEIISQVGAGKICNLIDPFCLHQAFVDEPSVENAIAISRIFGETMDDAGKQKWVKKSFAKSLLDSGFTSLAQSMT